MERPDTPENALSLVRRSRLLPEAIVAELEVRMDSGEPSLGVFARLVADGLLTPYQASELAAGRWQAFWLGGYKILDRLGKGGMGHVFLAEHAVLGKRVAVKVLSDTNSPDLIARRRFLREAQAAAVVNHPNVVQVFDIDVEHNPPYLVMEYVDGVSLQAAVARHGTLSVAETVAVGIEVTRGLAAAADAGLVHRDIKPANLLIDRRGGVKILDLGIVRLPGDDCYPKVDGPNLILGTLDYLAPEQAVDATEVDFRADLYSLGATLYFALAGHPPFPSTDLHHKLVAKQYSDPPPIHRLRPDVPTGLSAVVQKLLARDPATRYQSPPDAATALNPFIDRTPDFPGRLFQSRSSQQSNETKVGATEEELTATERFPKPLPRVAPTLDSEFESAVAEQATATTRTTPTDLALTPLPTQNTQNSSVAHSPSKVNQPRVWQRVLLWAFVALIGLALAWLIFQWL